MPWLIFDTKSAVRERRALLGRVVFSLTLVAPGATHSLESLAMLGLLIALLFGAVQRLRGEDLPVRDVAEALMVWNIAWIIVSILLSRLPRLRIKVSFGINWTFYDWTQFIANQGFMLAVCLYVAHPFTETEEALPAIVAYLFLGGVQWKKIDDQLES